MNLNKIFLLLLKILRSNAMSEDIITLHPKSLRDYTTRKPDNSMNLNYWGQRYNDDYINNFILTLKLSNVSDYYLHFTTKEILYTKTPQLSSVLLCRRATPRHIVVEKKIKLEKFKDEQSLVEYLYNKIFVEQLDLSNDDTTLLEDL